MDSHKQLLQKDLNALRDKIINSGFDILVDWYDEYGGIQCVTLNHMDHLTVVRKKNENRDSDQVS